MEKPISYYLNGITTTKPYKAIALADVAKAVKCQRSKKLTHTLRSIADREEAARYKRMHFDYVTFSGTFNTRKCSELIAYSGYMVIDLDDVDPVEAKNKLLCQRHFDVALMFTSPSGYGVKVVVASTTADEHKQVFRMYQRFFDKRLGLQVDSSGSDIARACFVAYDEELYYNPHAQWRKIEEYWEEEEEQHGAYSTAFVQSATPRPIYASQSSSGGYNGLSPFDDFNSRGNVVALLKAHNWTINKGASNDANIRFTRPGKNGGNSADLRISDRLFYVFTSNSQFQPMRAYNPAQVFAVLECGGDFSTAYRQLLAMGYGEPPRGSWVSSNTFNSEQKAVNSEQ